MKACGGGAEFAQHYVSQLSDGELLSAVSKHADAKFWKQNYVKRQNQAYLRRWGAYLRREARRRGLM